MASSVTTDDDGATYKQASPFSVNVAWLVPCPPVRKLRSRPTGPTHPYVLSEVKSMAAVLLLGTEGMGIVSTHTVLVTGLATAAAVFACINT
jgi:hypothetical protein